MLEAIGFFIVAMLLLPKIRFTNPVPPRAVVRPPAAPESAAENPPGASGSTDEEPPAAPDSEEGPGEAGDIPDDPA